MEQGTGYERNVIRWPAFGRPERKRQKQGDPEGGDEPTKSTVGQNALLLTKPHGEKAAMISP